MTDNKTKQIFKEILDWVKTIVLALLSTFFIKFFILDLTRIAGASMENTLFTDDLVVIEKISKTLLANIK